MVQIIHFLNHKILNYVMVSHYIYIYDLEFSWI